MQSRQSLLNLCAKNALNGKNDQNTAIFEAGSLNRIIKSSIIEKTTKKTVYEVELDVI